MSILKSIGDYVGRLLFLHSHSKKDNVFRLDTELQEYSSEGDRIVITSTYEYCTYVGGKWIKEPLNDGDTFYCISEDKEYRYIDGQLKTINAVEKYAYVDKDYTLQANDDVNMYIEPGMYYIYRNNNSNIKNIPVASKNVDGHLIVMRNIKVSNYNTVTQLLVIKDDEGDAMYMRVGSYGGAMYYRNNTIAVTYKEWSKLSVSKNTAQIYKGTTLPSNSIGKVGDIYIRSTTREWTFINTVSSSVSKTGSGETAFIKVSNSWWQQIAINHPSIPK